MTQEKPTKLTVDLQDRDLYRALRHAAVDRDQPLRDIVVEALRQWLERYEDRLDVEAIATTAGEETFQWDQIKREMREGRADFPPARVAEEGPVVSDPSEEDRVQETPRGPRTRFLGDDDDFRETEQMPRRSRRLD